MDSTRPILFFTLTWGFLTINFFHNSVFCMVQTTYFFSSFITICLELKSWDYPIVIIPTSLDFIIFCEELMSFKITLVSSHSLRKCLTIVSIGHPTHGFYTLWVGSLTHDLTHINSHHVFLWLLYNIFKNSFFMIIDI